MILKIEDIHLSIFARRIRKFDFNRCVLVERNDTSIEIWLRSIIEAQSKWNSWWKIKMKSLCSSHDDQHKMLTRKEFYYVISIASKCVGSLANDYFESITKFTETTQNDL